MKILLLHNRYQIRGGEDQVVDQELHLLKQKGHQVELLEASNHSIESLKDQARVAVDLLRGSEASTQKLLEKFKTFEPDLIHIHNWFPLWTTSIYPLINKLGIPIVQTLHNFRLFCANSLCLRSGQPCELCLKGSSYPAAVFGCYRGSRIGSLAVAHSLQKHRADWNQWVDQFIVLSHFSKQKYVEFGIAEEKLNIKPNFCQPPLPRVSHSSSHSRKPFLYVGRLSPEKGIETLIRAWNRWKGNEPLKVIGDGPLRTALQRHANRDKIQFLGELPRTAVFQELENARGVIIPSECYENFPVVAAEAFARGVPVIASRIGSLQEIITNQENGLLFEPKSPESLLQAVDALLQSDSLEERLKHGALSSFHEKYTSEVNYQILFTVYEKALRQKGLQIKEKMGEVQAHDSNQSISN